MNGDTLKTLAHVARIADVIVDGDDATRIITQDAMYHLARESAKYRFLTLDHYNVDIDTFLRMKKLLLRLEQLEEPAYCCSLWVPVPTTAHVTLAVQNGNVNRYYVFGQKTLATPEPMRRCMDKREIVTIEADETTPVATALAPIRDSMERVAAVLELSAATGQAEEYA